MQVVRKSVFHSYGACGCHVLLPFVGGWRERDIACLALANPENRNFTRYESGFLLGLGTLLYAMSPLILRIHKNYTAKEKFENKTQNFVTD